MPYSLSAAQESIAHHPTEADDVPVVRLMRTVAVLGMIFGLAGMLSLPLGLSRLHSGSFAGDVRVHHYSPLIEQPTIDALWMYVASASGAGLGGMLFVGSAVSLSFKKAGRITLIMWAIGSLGLGAIGCFFYFRWLLPPWREHLAEVRGVVDSLVNFGGWGIGSMLAIVMLILLTRPQVKEAFERGQKAV
jgi:hypothetical protein